MLAEADRYALCSRSWQPSPGSVVCKRRLWWGIAPPPACVKCGACAVVVGVGRVEVRHCRDPSRGGRRRRGDSSHRGRQLNITFEPDPHKKDTLRARTRSQRRSARPVQDITLGQPQIHARYSRDVSPTDLPGPECRNPTRGTVPTHHIAVLRKWKERQPDGDRSSVRTRT